MDKKVLWLVDKVNRTMHSRLDAVVTPTMLDSLQRDLDSIMHQLTLITEDTPMFEHEWDPEVDPLRPSEVKFHLEFDSAEGDMRVHIVPKEGR